MPRTRIKICGITRPQDAQLAADLGADAIGLNFFTGPRKIDCWVAGEILSKLDSFPLLFLVGLIGPDTKFQVEDTGGCEEFIFESMHYFQTYNMTLVHGPPDPRAIGNVYGTYSWHVCQVANRFDLTNLRDFLKREYLRLTGPAALVLDTAVKGHLGGTGQSFNWHWIEARAAGELTGLPPLILAGGLTPDNVADAIRIVRPYAVNVSSGVEVPNHPGIKDPARLRDFIQAVHAADAEMSAHPPAA